MKLKPEKSSSIAALIIFFLMGTIAFGVGIGMSLSAASIMLPFIFFAVLGGIFMLIAIIGIISVFKAKYDRNKLLREGVLYKGTIIGTEEHPTSHINHVHPQTALCQFTDNMTGGLRTVKSDYYYNNLVHYVGREVDIYIDRRNCDKCYVDMLAMVNGYVDPMSKFQVHDFRD